MDKRLIEPGHITILGTVMAPVVIGGKKYYSIKRICNKLNVDLEETINFLRGQRPAEQCNIITLPKGTELAMDYFSFLRWMFSYSSDKPTSDLFFQYLNELYQALYNKMQGNE